MIFPDLRPSLYILFPSKCFLWIFLWWFMTNNEVNIKSTRLKFGDVHIFFFFFLTILFYPTVTDLLAPGLPPGGLCLNKLLLKQEQNFK